MKVHLVDGCFYASGRRSASLGGENTGLGPQYFEWTTEPTAGVTFYTDMCLDRALDSFGRKVAWLIEPPWKRTHYDWVCKNAGALEYVLSYVRDLPVRNLLYYPHGGSLIKLDDWGVHDKSAMASIIFSQKRTAPGHVLRRAAALPDGTDRWGYGYRPTESLIPALRPYRYSVVVESCQVADYFSEKLIDCLSQGTVPIYWGCPHINRYFDERGIITFEHVDELEEILGQVVSEADYRNRLPYIRLNLELAKRYRCCEDWIYREYPWLFQ